MSTVFKVALLILLVQLVGALHYAVPFFVRAFNPAPIADPMPQRLVEEASNQVQADPRAAAAKGLWPMIELDDLQQGTLLVESDGQAPMVGRLPLLDSDFDVQVTGLSAQTRLVQSFYNPLSETLQGKFVFPLPPNAAVYGMKLIVGENIIQGEIKPKAEARATFEKARQSGHKASLLTQYRPNVFTTQVANIEPGDRVSVEISYQQALFADQRMMSLRIPNSVKPRYHPKADIAPQWSRNPSDANTDIGLLPEPNVVAGPLRISILLNGNIPMDSLDSGDFTLSVDDSQADSLRLETRLSRNTDRDYVLKWALPHDQNANTLLFTERWEGHTYGLLMLTPPEKLERARLAAQDWHFIIDTSGSMHGDALTQAKHALLYALNTLRSEDRINILAFSSATQPLWPESRPATAENKQLATQFVKQLQAEGGTEIAGALSQSFAQLRGSAHPEMRQQIVFLTDGSVGNEAQLMNLIQQNIGNTRLFTVGIGAAPNAYFMQEAAMAGHGAYVYIDDSAQVSKHMRQLIDKITRPALTQIQLDMAKDAQVFPSPVPDLYAGEPQQIVFRQEDPVVRFGMQAQTTLLDQQSTWKPAQIYPVETESSGIHRLWARQAIATLQRKRRRAEDVSSYNRKIEAVAMRHALVSDRTSLVAVEQSPARQNLQMKTELAMRLPQTATPMQRNGLLGSLCLLLSLSAWLWWRRH